ncbi:multiple epidermal growth factor-like domains protein 10 isoform X2 [Ostrea edulis]|uniref:multiple epidermal growth factor-like domains protein 10 isoform X2 n=1 Tax=Ostrea edulis TaxID=37623 RepID=UPI0024AF7195|nr:multiple epidermal growth factor-like domains protein 10 isoform X2 [Ostrea edulis]
MYRRWIYMCLVFYLTLETSYSQCSDDKTCECHCNCCSNCLGFYCTSCNREGWSGLTANGCQRKNIAYNQTTYQKSTNTDSSNAVDEKISTYSRTEVQKNPWIKVKFDKIERVKHMFITLSAECSTGTYGYLCDKTCVKCMDNQCDGFTGVCIKGCKSGWYGDRCDVECPSDCESGSCASGNNCTRCLPGYFVMVIVSKTVTTVLQVHMIVKHVNLDFMEVTVSTIVLLNALPVTRQIHVLPVEKAGQVALVSVIQNVLMDVETMENVGMDVTVHSMVTIMTSLVLRIAVRNVIKS